MTRYVIIVVLIHLSIEKIKFLINVERKISESVARSVGEGNVLSFRKALCTTSILDVVRHRQLMARTLFKY